MPHWRVDCLECNPSIIGNPPPPPPRIEGQPPPESCEGNLRQCIEWAKTHYGPHHHGQSPTTDQVLDSRSFGWSITAVTTPCKSIDDEYHSIPHYDFTPGKDKGPEEITITH